MGLVDSLIVDPLAAGQHSVTLGGLADNCSVDGGPTVPTQPKIPVGVA